MNRLPEGNSREASFLRRLLLLGPHTCPWWFGYSFDNPLRRLVHDPVSIFGEFVAPGQTAVDIGCGLGYFSLALARLVGPGGRVIALDMQSQMVQRASNRAQRQGLQDIIDFRVCSPDKLGVTESADFVLAFWVVHEVADQQGLLTEVHSFLKPGGRLLMVEPKGHVSAARYAATLALARQAGYSISPGPRVRFSRAAICTPM